MIKKEENPQNLNINFKIKISRKFSKEDAEKWAEEELAKKLIKEINKSNPGIYAQLQTTKRPAPYNKYSTLTLNTMEEVFKDLFGQPTKDKDRKIGLNVGQAGLEAFNKALVEDHIKNTKKKDEHRKRLSFQSKILKQTYKFR